MDLGVVWALDLELCSGMGPGFMHAPYCTRGVGRGPNKQVLDVQLSTHFERALVPLLLLAPTCTRAQQAATSVLLALGR